jgi:hypothetical protein
LVVFSALILTLMIGVAVGAIAIALRSGATG